MDELYWVKQQLQDLIDRIGRLESRILTLEINQPPPTVNKPYPYVPTEPRCPVCGLSGLTNYYCARMDCPSKFTVTSRGSNDPIS